MRRRGDLRGDARRDDGLGLLHGGLMLVPEQASQEPMAMMTLAVRVRVMVVLSSKSGAEELVPGVLVRILLPLIHLLLERFRLFLIAE